MTENRKQWSLVASLVLAVGAGLAVVTALRPQLVLVEPGRQAPHFTARNIATDSVVSLASYRGKVVLLNIWATWCAPCREEMPSMERVKQKFAGTDFRVVAVSVDVDDKQLIQEFVQEFGLTFDVLHDPARAIERTYQTTGVPESFVIDRDGVIVKKVIGAIHWDSPVNETLIQRLLDAQ